MKYILTATLLLFSVLGTTIAQEEKSAAEFKNEGNAALKAKDYKKALASYEAAVAAWDDAEEMDAAMIYNAATCARKSKKVEKALKYYLQSKELGYKKDAATYYIADAYSDLGKLDLMEETFLQGIKDYGTSKYVPHMKKKLATHYVKEGNDFFTKGISLLNTRTEGNRDQWDAIKEKSKVEFDKATEFANKALEINPNDAAAKTMLTKIDELLKS